MHRIPKGGTMKNPFQNKFTLLVVAVALVAGVAYVLTQTTQRSITPLPTGAPDGTACTMDAKICADGSSVGRTGPNCEFAPCPSPADQSTWKLNELPELYLKFSSPPELTFTKDVQKDDKGKVSLITMYLQQGQPGQTYYQLYGIYQPADVSAETLEEFKGDFTPETVVDTTVGGHKAVSGQIKGERNRLATYILLDGGVFKLLTAEPTAENKIQTDAILKTMIFGK